MKKIYLASPLGFSEVGRDFMYNRLIPTIESTGYLVLDPWKLTSQDLIDSTFNLPNSKEKLEKLKSLNNLIGENNVKAIKRSSGLIAVLDGVDVDSGTASEIGYASALQKPILGYRGDFRLSADNEGSIVNLQVEYFIKNNGGKIITSIDDIKYNMHDIFG